MMDGPTLRLSTGVDGLDEVLCGGLIARRAYLVRGGPGVGKTLLSLHFLARGAAVGERCLFISLGQSEALLRDNAARQGLNIADVTILDLSPNSQLFSEARSYEIFRPAEVERGPVTQRIMETVEACRPQRVVVDPITQYRYLSTDAHTYRRQVVAFAAYLIEHGATVMVTSETTGTAPDDDLLFLAHGIITLEFAGYQRQVSVAKFLGSPFALGQHAARISDTGLAVFPHLVPGNEAVVPPSGQLGSGITALDRLLGGGLERGTTTFVAGPSGSGKTTLALAFARHAAVQGMRTAVYTFEQTAGMVRRQADGIRLPLDDVLDVGTLTVQTVQPRQYLPDEFARLVVREAEAGGTHLVVLDSARGYCLSMLEEEPADQLYALLRALTSQGATVIVTAEAADIWGNVHPRDTIISCLADTVVVLQQVTVGGRLRKTVGVLKKRLGAFEDTPRELTITGRGVEVGAPLPGTHAILPGIPAWTPTEE